MKLKQDSVKYHFLSVAGLAVAGPAYKLFTVNQRPKTNLEQQISITLRIDGYTSSEIEEVLDYINQF